MFISYSKGAWGHLDSFASPKGEVDLGVRARTWEPGLLGSGPRSGERMGCSGYSHGGEESGFLGSHPSPEEELGPIG